MNAPVQFAEQQTVSGAEPFLAAVARPAGRLQAFAKGLLKFCVFAGLATLSYLFISTFLVSSVQVSGESMQPTLLNGERCLLNRWIFYVRAPRVGDIVVLRDPTDNGYSVKRIVGSAGDSFHIATGEVVKNRQVLNETYLAPKTPTYPKATVREQDIQCREGQFVVMGDNRMNSMDSRHYGPVPAKRILGLVIR